MRLHVSSASEWESWKSAMAPYDSIFGEYKSTRSDVPAQAGGVYYCSYGDNTGDYYHHYVLRNFPLSGTVLFYK
jgi:hypothetical protein